MVSTAVSNTHTVAYPYILAISSKGVMEKISLNMLTTICTNARLVLFYNGRKYIYFWVLRSYGRHVVHRGDIHLYD
jgi:hypothetical protein